MGVDNSIDQPPSQSPPDLRGECQVLIAPGSKRKLRGQPVNVTTPLEDLEPLLASESIYQ